MRYYEFSVAEACHHQIRQSTRQYVPEHHICVDTETYVYEDRHTFRLGAACYLSTRTNEEEWAQFTSRDQFWQFLYHVVEKVPEVWVWAHNMDYDAQILGLPVYVMANSRWSVELCVLDGLRFIIVAWYRANTPIQKRYLRRVVFLSSTNYVPIALATLGKAVGREKLVDTTPLWKHSDNNVVMQYCIRDVEIVRNFVKWFIQYWSTHRYGSFGLTAASCAMRAFTAQYLPTPIAVHRIPHVLDLEVDAYKGGRTECFRIGRYRRVYVYDVNAMYPYVMSQFAYPVRVRAQYDDITESELIDLARSRLVIARVRVDVRRPVVGYRLHDRLVFPIGRFWVTVTSPEIALIQEHGRVLECARCITYDGAKLFGTYVNDLYTQRMTYRSQGNSVYDLLAKLLMNSLYGKFGQRTPRWRVVDTAPIDVVDSYSHWDCDEQRYHHFRVYGGRVYLQDGYHYGFYTFPAIASFVSAYARCYLYRILELTGYDEDSGFHHAYYCDTDSVFVDEIGAKRITEHGLVGSELGKLKCETIGEEITINGLKDYTIEGEKRIVKLKGIRKDAILVDPPTRTYRQHHFLHLQTNIKSYKYDGVVVEQILKRIRGKYDKGVVHNGIVVPYVITE